LVFSLVNTGGTETTIRRSYVEVCKSDVGIHPGTIHSRNYLDPEKVSDSGYVIAAGDRHQISIDISQTFIEGIAGGKTVDTTHAPISVLGEVESTSILGFAKGEQDLYVFGWIRFRDEIGVTRQMGFCRRYDSRTGVCGPVEGTNLEYEA
jgi:hypothetical protein